MSKFNSALIVEYGVIRLVLLEKKNGSVRYFAEKSVHYDGFNEQGFLNPEDVFTKVREIFTLCESEYGPIDRSTDVVLPGIFYKYIVGDVDVPTADGTVKPKDIAALFEASDAGLPGYEAEENLPINFKTACSAVTLNPLGEKSPRLAATISVGYLKKSVMELFDNCAKRTGREFTYRCACSLTAEKAEAKLSNREARIIVSLADGYTDVILCKGSVPIDVRSLLWGETHLIYAISEVVKTDDKMSQKLLKTVNLNLNSASEDAYKIGGAEYSIKDVNLIIKEVVQYFGREINGALLEMTDDLLPTYVTGSDICERRGIKEIFETETGREVICLISERINLEGCGKFLLAAVAESKNLH